ncbi:ParA family protein (plasmid) [Kitasatospora sp. NBC_00070]
MTTPVQTSVQSSVLVVSTDPQGSTVWWADRVGDSLPFDFLQTHDDPAGLKALRDLGAKVHVVCNQKGGVGKTTLTVNCAAVVHDTIGTGSTGYRHIFIDTPGSLEDENLLAASLDIADDVIVPMPPEPLAFDPTARTIERVIKPRGLPYRVVVNNWDPRDGKADLEDTRAYITAMGWERTNAVVRRYKLHTRASAEGKVVTQYQRNRIAMEAREDFFRLALELGYGAH